MSSDFEELVLGVRCVRWDPQRTRDGRVARVSNFGDLLGPLIARRIIETSRLVLDTARARRVLTVGSVLHFAQPGDVVWGTGINGKVGEQTLPPSLDVRAIRGPYTRAVLAARGIAAPPVFGDPALLLDRLWPERKLTRAPKTRALVTVPNLNEMERFGDESVRSPLDDPWAVISDIAASEFVTGTSLHALVVADALGIPSRPISPLAESTFKYLDYYAGTGRPEVVFAASIEEALDMGPIEPARFDADRLLDAFPLDVWTGTTAPRADQPGGFRALRTEAESTITELSKVDAPSSEAEEAIGRLRMLAMRNPPLDGLTRKERQEFSFPDPIVLDRDAPPPLLSVVIPTHNVLPWVGETIHSVLEQDVEGLEVIVIDDHSTDGTRELLDNLARDPRVRVVDAVSRGGGTARNIGIDHARGRYLAFCDGDDLVAPGAYRELVRSLEASGSDIAFGDYVKFSPNRTWSPTRNWPAYRSSRHGITLDEEPSLLNGRPCWNKVFRRSFWDGLATRFPDVPRSNDIVPMVTAYLEADRIDVLDAVVYLYRERPGTGSMTARAASSDSLVSYLTQELACARLIRSSGSPRIAAVYKSLILDRDGWVHLAKHLRSADRDTSQDGLIVDRVRELLGTIGAAASSTRSPQKRMVFELLIAGSLELAAAVAVALDGDNHEISRLHQAWTRIFHAEELIGTDLLGDRLITTIIDEILDGADSDVALLIDLVRRLPDTNSRLLLAIPEFADARAVSDDTLRDRIIETRRFGAVLTSVRSGGSITLSLNGNLSTGDRPGLYDERSGRTIVVERLHRLEGGGSLRAHMRAASLPRVALRPVLTSSDGRARTIRFAAQTPEYSRFDRIGYLFDGRGVLIERRGPWLVRAARRGVRGLARRVRRLVAGS
ncbi:glycosyltransferase [Agromyces sp. NPDC058104]|uniref:glycosyltransferase n=1 Tax=Agromyces sp. NPDC058104 TaxID=3346342 RepID=UPI0036DAC3B3